MDYFAFGVPITSQIPLSLPAMDASRMEGFGPVFPGRDREKAGKFPPIAITLGEVEPPESIQGPQYSVGNITYAMEGERILVSLPRAGRLEILGNAEIRAQRAVVGMEGGLEGAQAEAPEGLLAASITCFAFLFILKKRGFITLHGSAVSDGTSAFLILGEKGGGKSTSAAALSQEGFASYADDLALVSPHGEVYPGNPIARLLPDAQKVLYGEPGLYGSPGDDFDGVAKREFQLAAELEPRKLGAIFILRPVDSGRLKVTEARGAAKAAAVFPHFSALPGLDTPAALITLAEACIKNISVYILERPAAGDSLKEVVAAIRKAAR
ncbi:MAG: hypothetical protein AB1407_12435 [Spirochaetota bacterium]